LTTWCEAAVATLVDNPGSADTPEQAEANAAVRETLFTELTRLSNESVRDAAEMRLAGILAENVVLETVDWEMRDLSPVLFGAALPESVDAGGRDHETASVALFLHSAANC
jgi:hypothetical protein